jgi:tRNA A37 threonylcarbamoyladenosine biosynthesis protein TsaE
MTPTMEPFTTPIYTGLNDMRGLYEIGLLDDMKQGIRMVEWAEKASGFLPENTLWLKLDFTEDTTQRNLALSGKQRLGRAH